MEKDNRTATKTVELVVAQKASLDWRDIFGDLTLTTGQNTHTHYWSEHSHSLLVRTLTLITGQNTHTHYWSEHSHSLLVRALTLNTGQNTHTHY